MRRMEGEAQASPLGCEHLWDFTKARATAPVAESPGEEETATGEAPRSRAGWGGRPLSEIPKQNNGAAETNERRVSGECAWEGRSHPYPTTGYGQYLPPKPHLRAGGKS